MRADDMLRRLAGPAGIAGILLLFVALGTLLVVAQFTSTVVGLFAAAALMIIFWISVEPEQILNWLRGRQARYGSNAAIMSAAFLGILIVVNFLASKHSQLWDVTASHRYTLSSQTLRVLSSLQAPVTMTAFYSESGQGNTGKKDAEQLLDQYAKHSPMIKVNFVDPDAQPGIAQQYNIRAYGSVVVQSQDKKQTVDFGTERDYTSAILKVISNQSAKLYFLTGHGERDLADTSDAGLQQFSDALKKVGNDTAPLTLGGNAKIPADASGIVIASPQKELLPEEVTAIRQYLDLGGHAMILSEAYPKVDVNPLVTSFGITVENGIVVDLVQYLQAVGQVAPGIVQYPSSAVTRNLQGVQTFYPNATGLTVKTPAPAGMQVQPILTTSTQSYLTRSEDRSNLKFNAQSDVRGPITIGVLATKPTAQEPSPGATPSPTPATTGTPVSKETRVIIVGDVAWLTNKYFRALGNQDLALSTANYVAEQDQLVDIPAPPAENRSLFLSASQANLVLFGNFLFVPIIVLLVGFYTWLRRR